ncbi:MAG: hypothetical protein Q9160_003708 [Pyrenula sp. 1 TL-2023]
MHRPRHPHPSSTLVNRIYSAAQHRNVPVSRRRVEDIVKSAKEEEVEEWFKGLRGEGEEEAKEGWNHISHTPSLARQFLTDHSTDSTAPNNDIDSILALTDSDFRDAIKSLEASTAAIEAQAKALEGQWRAMHGLVRREKEVEREGKRVGAGLARKRGLEVQDLDFRISDLHNDIASTLKTRQDAIPTRFKTAEELVAETLLGDDRILERLNGLLPTSNADDQANQDDVERETEDPGIAAELARIDKLCMLLTALLREEITTRLDITYLQHSSPSPTPRASSTRSTGAEAQSPGPEPSAETETETEEDILTDLNSLHTEIPTVADLYVNTLFRQPLHLALHRQEQDRKARHAEKGEEITRTIEEMTHRLDDTTRRIEGLMGERKALKAIGAQLDASASASVVSPPQQHQTLASPSSGSLGLKNTNPPTTAEALRNINQNTSLSSLLSHLGLPTRTSTSKSTSNEHNQKLHKALLSHLHKSHRSVTELQSSLYAPLKLHLASLAQADRILNDTLDVASTNTDGDGDNDRKGDRKSGSAELERRMGEVGQGIEELAPDVDVQDGVGMNTADARKARERFVRRWAGQP